MDQPSPAMWCMVSATTWSSSARRSSRPRSSGPRARSNARAASSRTGRGPAPRARLRQPRQVHQRQREGLRRLDHLDRRSLGTASGPRRRCAAPRAGARSLPGARQHRDVQRPLDPQRPGHVVERAARLELIEEPEPLLREGQRQRALGANGTRGGAGGPRRSGAWPRPAAAKSASVGASKRSRSGSSIPNASRSARHHPRRQQRVAAQVEEVVAHPTRSSPSTSAQMPASDLLDRRPRRHVLLRGARPSGAGSALRSTLPFGVSGSAGERHEGGRHHVAPAAGAQAWRQRFDRPAPPTT